MRGGKRGLEAFSIEPDIGKGKGINEPINYGGKQTQHGGGSYRTHRIYFISCIIYLR